jgi:Flp pilus assembly protein TadG
MQKTAPDGPLSWRRDQRGVSAVEFALVLPLIISMYVGAVEFSHALTIDRRVTSVASAAADLVAQSEEVSSSDLQDIFTASSSIMLPSPASPVTLVRTSVEADEDNETAVAWSCGSNGGEAHAEDEDYDLPEGLTQPFSSVIVAEVSYKYTPLVGEHLTGGITMSDTFYLRPRRSMTVEKTDDNCA